MGSVEIHIRHHEARSRAPVRKRGRNHMQIRTRRLSDERTSTVLKDDCDRVRGEATANPQSLCGFLWKPKKPLGGNISVAFKENATTVFFGKELGGFLPNTTRPDWEILAVQLDLVRSKPPENGICAFGRNQSREFLG